MKRAIHILYVEDDQIDRMYFSRLLSREEHQINLTTVEGIKELKDLPDRTQFDFLITDLFLRDGNASDVMEIVSGIPAILLSSETDQSLLENVVKKPLKAVLSKPLQWDKLLEVIVDDTYKSDSSKQENVEMEQVYQAIKIANLERLARGDAEGVRELVNMSLDLLLQRKEEMEKAFETANWNSLHLAAHATKSLIRMVGIPAYEIVDQIDQIARKQPDETQLNELYEALKPIMNLAHEELNRALLVYK